MLTIVLPENEQIRQHGLEAATFCAQPFWQEFQKELHQIADECLRAAAGAKDATDSAKARLLDRWIWTKDIVARIERIPQAAIEAARELGEE